MCEIIIVIRKLNTLLNLNYEEKIDMIFFLTVIMFDHSHFLTC